VPDIAGKGRSGASGREATPAPRNSGGAPSRPNGQRMGSGDGSLNDK